MSDTAPSHVFYFWINGYISGGAGPSDGGHGGSAAAGRRRTPQDDASAVQSQLRHERLFSCGLWSEQHSWSPMN